MKAYLLDIEGTTTPIDFVHKVLFPYARERVVHFVNANFAALQTEIAQLASEHGSEGLYPSSLETALPESVAAYLAYLIDTDRKSTPLKSIQGKIWRAGYEAGEIRSQIFDDVAAAFEKWKAAGKTIAIYSSGSVLAQKNLFKYTDHGDLTCFISKYFDTNVGGKREAASYGKIATELNFRPGDILFVSDIPQELDAAIGSGLAVRLALRPGNAVVDAPDKYQIIRALTEI
ncbi:MAG: acireductone synthase [Acidobacteriota bacterium]